VTPQNGGISALINPRLRRLGFVSGLGHMWRVYVISANGAEALQVAQEALRFLSQCLTPVILQFLTLTITHLQPYELPCDMMSVTLKHRKGFNSGGVCILKPGSAVATALPSTLSQEEQAEEVRLDKEELEEDLRRQAEEQKRVEEERRTRSPAGK